MQKDENYFLKAMSPNMMKLYSLVKTLTPCDAMGIASKTESNYMVYPYRQNQLHQIRELLSFVGVVKIIDFKLNGPQAKSVLILPYKTCRIMTQRLAVKHLANAFRRVDSLGFLMEHGGLEMSPAEEKYFTTLKRRNKQNER